MTDTDTDRLANRDAVTYLYWAALAMLGLLAAIALVQFYLSASRAVSVWVNREYRPVFQAMFNLVVLLGAGVGVSLVLRRLTALRDPAEGASASATDEPSPPAPDEPE